MKKLGELLVEREWVTRDQLTQALRHQGVFGGRLGTCLLELTLLSEDRLTRALSEQLAVPPVTQDDLRVIAEGMLHLVPAKLACRARAIPFERFGNALSVAVVDPRDLVAQDELSFVTSRRLKVHVAPEVRILEALEKHYSCSVEPRYARIWDRLNRAKYLWQEESPASAGSKRRIDSAPVPPAPMRTVDAPDWQPPPPLDTGVGRLAAALRAAEGAAPPPGAAASLPPHVQPAAVAADAAVAAPPEATPTPATAPRRRWFFGRQPASAAEVAQRSPAPAAASLSAPPSHSPAPQAPVPQAPVPSVLQASAHSAPADRPAVPVPARSPSAAKPAAKAPATKPVAPLASSEVVVLPAVYPKPASPPAGARREAAAPAPAPTPTPLVQRAPPPTARAAPPKEIVTKPAETLEDFEERIDEVEERDDVAHAALSFLSRRFQRSVLFMVRGNTVAVWMGGGEGVDQRLLADIDVSFEEPSLFLNLREGSPFYRGPLPRLDAHQRLVRVWGGKYPKECLLLPVRIKKRLVAVVYGDRGNEDLHEVDIPEMQQMAALMARGFEAVLVKRKRS